MGHDTLPSVAPVGLGSLGEGIFALVHGIDLDQDLLVGLLFPGLEFLGRLDMSSHRPQVTALVCAAEDEAIALECDGGIPDEDDIVLRPHSEYAVGLRSHAELEVELCTRAKGRTQ